MEKNKKEIEINIDLTGFFYIIIFLAFFIAKILGKIDWSWWWVFSPLWIPLAIIGGALLVVGIIYVGIIIKDKLVLWRQKL